MHIAALSCLILPLLLPFVNFTYSLRAQRASRKSLAHIKSLINEDAARQYSFIQNDAMDVFIDILKNPNAAKNKDELTVNNPEDYFQGDVDLSEQQVQQLEREYTNGKREKRKVGRAPLYKKWDATRPISFDFAETVPRATRVKIRDAMRLWQRNTCVRFEEGGPNVDRLEFFDGGGCSSFVGKVGGTQGISIATPGCDVVGIISHEIGHALGIFHEQARPDQDRHISINYNNIPISRWNNFQSISTNQADTYNLPYDTGSVMHYGPYGFASDPYTPTIRTLERTQQSTIGQRAGPSFLDYQAINVAYGCVEHCPPLVCLHNGYPHPNNCSICACPDGLTGRFCEQVSSSNRGCGGVIMARQEIQYISSPNYPNNFPLNTECYWMIQAAPGGRAFLEFVGDFDFLCEDTCDKSYVEVKYHNDKRLTGARYCCSSIPTHRFISFNNELVVLMKGFGGVSKGFNARFWSDKLDIITTETQTPAPIKPIENIASTTTFALTLPPILTTETSSYSPSTTSEIVKMFPFTPWISVSNRLPSSTDPSVFTIFPTATTTQISTLTVAPKFEIFGTTQTPDVINLGIECRCNEWAEWIGVCSQQCGGCGHRRRTRVCQKDSCRKEEKRPCNFNVCPTGTNFLINNGEFHILWRGCCVGLFRSGNECTALETNQNPFLKIISSLLSIQDAKNNKTHLPEKVPRGEH